MFRLVLCAVIRSVVSLSFSALSHRFFIPRSASACRSFLFQFSSHDPCCLFIFIAISPLRFGRPVAWPVSLWGQGELACVVFIVGAVGNVRVCQREHLVCVFSLSLFVAEVLIIFPLAISPSQFGRPGGWPVSL